MSELPVSAVIVLLESLLNQAEVKVVDVKPAAILVAIGEHKFMIGVQECE